MPTLGNLLSLLGKVFAMAVLVAETMFAQTQAYQTLKLRTPVITPELQAMYASSEFDETYRNAAAAYDEAVPHQPHAPVPWNSKKPLVWLGLNEREISNYSSEFNKLRHRLDAMSESPQVRADPKKVAQISQIQDRLTADNLKALNVLVRSVDLGGLFASNHKQDIAKLWSPWPVPQDKHVLDQGKMEAVVKFLYDVNTCLSESGRDHVRFARSASFSWNVPKDQDDTPLTLQQALVFWQWHNHAPLDEAVNALYDSLQKARTAAEEEGLLDIGS